MTIKQDNGELGEKEVCEFIHCPNCNGELFQLARNNPLYDVACRKCLFRAQVKSPQKKFREKCLQGAGWNIMDKALKAGIIIPSLIMNLKEEIRFYPYIPRRALIKRLARIKSENRLHWMFDYNLTDLKYYVLLNKVSSSS